MKVAVIVGGFPLISETFILRQITALLDLGHQVDIYARRRFSEEVVQPDVARHGLLKRVHYFNVSDRRWARVARALVTVLVEGPRHPRAVLKCLNGRRYPTTYAKLNNLFFVQPFLRRRYDAVLCYWGGNGIDFIVLKDVFPGMRFVTRFGGDDYEIGDEKGVESLALLRELGDTFIVNSDSYGRATLRRYGFADRKIVTLPNMLDVKHIAFRESVPSPGHVRLVSVARLVPKKGVEVAIPAVAALRAANPGLRIEYRIIGDGPLRPVVSAMIRDLRVEDDVELLGPLTTPDVFKRLEASDVYLLPSLSDQAPNVLLEAQAVGLPIVATRVGGVAEMVVENQSALLIPPGDLPAMVGALQYLIDNPTAWPAMGRVGRRHVEKHHDLEQLKVRLAGILGV